MWRPGTASPLIQERQQPSLAPSGTLRNSTVLKEARKVPWRISRHMPRCAVGLRLDEPLRQAVASARAKPLPSALIVRAAQAPPLPQAVSSAIPEPRPALGPARRRRCPADAAAVAQAPSSLPDLERCALRSCLAAAPAVPGQVGWAGQAASGCAGAAAVAGGLPLPRLCLHGTARNHPNSCITAAARVPTASQPLSPRLHPRCRRACNHVLPCSTLPCLWRRASRAT